MKLLGIETSTRIASVALWDAGKIQFCQETEVLASDILSDRIETVCRAGGVELEALDGFAVSIGPGSFTGLRVGVTTAKTLAWALSKPVLPVSSLAVIAQNFSDSRSELFLFLDAYKKKVYSALFSSDGQGCVERRTEDSLNFPESALQRVKGPARVIGGGVGRYGELVKARPELELTPSQLWVPRADRLCTLAARCWPAGLVDDPHTLVPQYLYSSESNMTGW